MNLDEAQKKADAYEMVGRGPLQPMTITSSSKPRVGEVFGDANREVATAIRYLQGYGYLVIGAEPGTLRGMQPIDSANLVTWIEQYTGGIGVGPQWDVHWVDGGGAHVLLISVSPPRDGDPPWPIRKEFTAVAKGQPINIRNGALYIRRNGKTVEADAAEVDMLAVRARGSGTRTQITVQPTGGGRVSIRPVDASGELLEPYLTARRALLMKSVVDCQTARRPDSGTGAASVMDELNRGANAVAAAIDRMSATSEPDPRSPEEYTWEVDEYIDALRKQLPAFVAWLAMKKHPQTLDLEVRNLTDHNFHQVAVDLHIGGSILAFDEVPTVPDLPKTPRPYGPTSRRFGSLYDNLVGASGGIYSPLAGLNPSFGPIDLSPRPRIRNGGSADVAYPALDVRPQAIEQLDEVYIIAGSRDAGQAVTAAWEATASSASGKPGGSFEIDVTSGPLTPGDLLGNDGEDPHELARDADAVRRDADGDNDR